MPTLIVCQDNQMVKFSTTFAIGQLEASPALLFDHDNTNVGT